MILDLSFSRLMVALSYCLDFVSHGLDRHHQRVTFTALTLAETQGLPAPDKEALLMAGIIHDVGASTWREKMPLMEFDVKAPWDHCRRGAQLFSRVSFLAPLAEIIFCHHDRWAGPNVSRYSRAEIPLAARIIHLADRVDVLLHTSNTHVLQKREEILDKLQALSGQVFDPELVAAFREVAARESFWLDLTSPFIRDGLASYPVNAVPEVTRGVLQEVAQLFAAIVDAKSPFTYRHSRGVAQVATALAAAMGFSQDEVLLMEVAGLLHDLGKLSVPDEILEKPGPLTRDEFSVMKQHTYYTYHILREAGDLDPLPAWAAYHHEKLDGTGYPFHIAAEGLSPGARLMAVADTFTALREDRPYRPGMSRPDIERILQEQVASRAFDREPVEALLDNYDHLEEMWTALST